MKHRIPLILSAAAALLLIAAGCSRKPEPPEPSESFRVYRKETGTVEDIPLRDYLIGTVGAEMPASFAPEALKAQTVAAHTYAEYFRRQQAAHPDAALQGAELSDDSARCQAYIPPSLLREQLGAAGFSAVEAAVDAVSGLLLWYDGEPAAAVYHACSSGRTESAEAVWGYAVPYLVPVDSPADRNAPQYEAAAAFSAAEVQDTLQNAGVSGLPDNPEMWFSEPVCTESGTVLTVICGDRALSGTQLRGMFELRSACFSVSYADGVFTFRTQGFGHGAGMSQYGANALAEQGVGFAEILQYYYPGTVCAPQKCP